jgi:hypothetical protein
MHRICSSAGTRGSTASSRLPHGEDQGRERPCCPAVAVHERVNPDQLVIGNPGNEDRVHLAGGVWYEMLLNVLLWILYDPERAYFGVYTWVGIVLALLGVPAIRYIVIIRGK